MVHKICLLCGRKLKNKESQELGLGATCASKLRKLDKLEKAKKKEKQEAKRLKDLILKGQVSLFDKEVVK